MLGWLIAFAVILFIIFLPLNYTAIYDENGLRTKARVWLFPVPKKKKKKKSDSKPEAEAMGGSVKEFVMYLKFAAQYLNSLRKKVRIKRLKVLYVMAGDDPCDLAMNYGKAWGVVGGIMPLLDEFLIIKKQTIDVKCDFEAEESHIYARLDATIPLCKYVALLFKFGVDAASDIVKLSNN